MGGYENLVGDYDIYIYLSVANQIAVFVTAMIYMYWGCRQEYYYDSIIP